MPKLTNQFKKKRHERTSKQHNNNDYCNFCDMRHETRAIVSVRAKSHEHLSSLSMTHEHEPHARLKASAHAHSRSG